MKNFISLWVSREHDILVSHNNQPLAYYSQSWIYCTNGVNILSVKNLSTTEGLEIKDLQMFELGSNKLKYLGVVEDINGTYKSTRVPPMATWKVLYQYPVFYWLHQTLDLGWIVKPTEQLV